MTGVSTDQISVRVVRSEQDLDAVATLFREYQEWLNQPVCFENFEEELATLPGVYRSPGGELWLAMKGETPIAVVGMAPYEGARAENAVEMKRLYVRDSAKGHGLGRKLAEGCVTWAREVGYQRIVLETFDELDADWSLYASMGFVVETQSADKPLKSPDFLTLQLT